MDEGSPHPPFQPGILPVFGLIAVFALFWIIAGLLFRKVARKESPLVASVAA